MLDLGFLLHVPSDPAAPCVTRTTLDWYSGRDSERAEAVEACHVCPLIIQCATAALERGEPMGVWGGLDIDAAQRAAKRDAFHRRKTEGPSRAYVAATCGTRSGYERHLRLREPACPACKRARADHSAAMRARRRQPA